MKAAIAIALVSAAAIAFAATPSSLLHLAGGSSQSSQICTDATPLLKKEIAGQLAKGSPFNLLIRYNIFDRPDEVIERAMSVTDQGMLQRVSESLTYCSGIVKFDWTSVSNIAISSDQDHTLGTGSAKDVQRCRHLPDEELNQCRSFSIEDVKALTKPSQGSDLRVEYVVQRLDDGRYSVTITSGRRN